MMRPNLRNLTDGATLMYPEYWQKACDYLSERDPVLDRIITEYEGEGLRRRSSAFIALARAIVGQQISVKAADSVWSRFEAALSSLSPEAVLEHDIESLRACGLSQRKAEYMRDLAAHFADDRLSEETLEAMDDAEVVKALTAIRGIGRWTAEMFLMFYLLRPDVFPVDDLGLLKAIDLHYSLPLEVLSDKWSPYRTVATWYLWRSLDPHPVAY